VGDRETKTALFDEFARAAKALASGRRIELLDVLANGDRTVEALAGEVGLSVANTSQHLQILRQAGLVTGRREGTSVNYRLAAPEVFQLWQALRTLAASRLAEVERLATAYLGARDELEPVSREELARRLQDGVDLVVLDVRPAAEYAAGICLGRCRSRSASCAGGWPSWPVTGRSSPTAAAPTAPSRMRPWPCCARPASRPGGWRMGCPNGRRPAWPSPAPDHRSSRSAEEPTMAVIHPVVDEGLGNSAYTVELGDGRALVVDSACDPTPYLELARWRRLRIAYSVETHLHADFLTGSRELAAAGAQVLAPRASRLGFAHRGLEDGEEVDLGGLTLRALATPGHAPEHISYLLLDGGRPVALFSGGALLVGTVARTDLAGPELTEPLARAAYRSLRQRLLSLPDELGVYPTHGAGSFCSAPVGGERTTTIGAERRHNRLLAAPDEDTFVAQLLASFGSYPPYSCGCGSATGSVPSSSAATGGSCLCSRPIGSVRTWLGAGC
jgi:glyoxylase-like metal-dependent hydrolase (beta-lactamase superfamily II)/DNA-binding transcriptional ArsR family regulator